jgi:SNF2 family DNA or RNA helicase
VCKGEGRCEQWFAVEREDDDGPVDDSVVTNAHDDEADRYELVMSGCSRCVGTGRVPKMVRDTKQIKTPKDQAVRDLLEENEDQGRIVIFAGFQGSIDRIVKICHSQQWNVVKVDGRGWKVQLCSGERTPNKTKPLDYWADMDNERVAFVAHPQSGGMGLTLTEACMAVFYSNDFSPESRWQAEDRIHRPGIDENKGATIVDLFHLGTDVKVLNVLRDNRRLEQMTLTEFQEMTDDD